MIPGDIITKGQNHLRIALKGQVQGVGFRPFVFNLASAFQLSGFVQNTMAGLVIEVEGDDERVNQFLNNLQNDHPQGATIETSDITQLPLAGFKDFQILPSEVEAVPSAIIPPDLATCPECLQEIFSKRNRRYLYPFTNCTHCGPRYSILRVLPYDRPNTSMDAFNMCKKCHEEYTTPRDRRFHAQPNTCPECGPQLYLCNQSGEYISQKQAALEAVVRALRQGQIVAVKGLGGFHLMVDAGREDAVARLRLRKHRDAKPFAVMFPSVAQIREHCFVSSREEALLASGAAPIVLLTKKSKSLERLALSIAPQNPYLGVLLPYTPLHHILLNLLNAPVVATSANLSDEPICFTDEEAFERLAGIADLFLTHNRPIVRPVEDSVVRIIKGETYFIRRSRGYAPLPVYVQEPSSKILAVGGQMKNTVALKVGVSVFVSQYLGDLANRESQASFLNTITDLRQVYPHVFDAVACDAHPDYASTRWAEEQRIPIIKTQHHHSHAVACMAEHGLEKALGIIWDGTGLGDDETIWGGEFLLATLNGYERVAHLRPFSLPGGEAAIEDNRRIAIGLLRQMSKDLKEFLDLPVLRDFSPAALKISGQMLTQNFNSPVTSSMGRLFDGVSALLGLCSRVSYEGQAAVALENALEPDFDFSLYPWKIHSGRVIDWEPMLWSMIEDLRNRVKISTISFKFHRTLVEMAVEVVKDIAMPDVVLSGGCFQNKFLLEHMIDRLSEEGFKTYWHRQVPANDGGLSLGQAVIAGQRMKKNLCV